MKKLILVNGIPASGKSTVTQSLSEYFNFPVLSIDEIKEPFMVQFADIIDRPLNRKLGHAAYESMFNIVNSSSSETVFILDAWFGFREKAILENYLKKCGCEKPIEIWNSISSDNVAERYKQRCGCRLKGHPGEEYIPELMRLAETAKPMDFGDVYIYDQNEGGNQADLIAWVRSQLNAN